MAMRWAGAGEIAVRWVGTGAFLIFLLVFLLAVPTLTLWLDLKVLRFDPLSPSRAEEIRRRGVYGKAKHFALIGYVV
ncbi:MAG TPA: hypothetical protein VM598_07800, partial [Bdellovibrionota bacterium]|nr:hypothetical protein [Bdellovibrionota bacterium]